MTTRPPRSFALVWQERVVAALRWIGLRPGTLFTVLWAVSAIAQPYANLVHDARLYALQVQNQISGGAFNGDLFLRFGSQDQYTPFSRLAAPMAAFLGIEWSFFVLYLVFNALLIFAIQRLVTALIDDPMLSAAALILMVLSPLEYGGLAIFHVTEPFFTPRLMSCALGALALERILRQRYVAGISIAAAATIIHPLMGFGVLAIGVVSAALDSVPRRFLIPMIAVAVVAGAAVLGYPPLGVSLFGTMDAEWLDVVRDGSAYNFPGQWTASDWINLSMSIGLPVWAAIEMSEGSPRRARFLFISAALGAVGVVTMAIAGVTPYRLLLQGQPYRAVWILQLLEIPVAFWLAARLWKKGLPGQIASVLLIGFFGMSNFGGPELGLSVIAVGFFLLFAQRPTSRTDPRDSIVPSLVAGLAAGIIVAGAIRAGVIAARTHEILAILGLRTYAGLLATSMGPMVSFAIVLWCIAAIVERRVRAGVIVAGALIVGVGTHAVAFTVPRLQAYRDTQIPYGRDLQFVRAYFNRQHPASAAPLTVYEGIWEEVDLVWFDLKAQNYFSLVQLSGVLFSRETALEARRRALIARPFELERYDAIRKGLPWGDKLMITSVFKPTGHPVSPTESDLVRLCRPEEQVDVAILKHDFGGRAAANNGRVYIYECAQVGAAPNSD